jgi:exopolysaccharide production protein ExoZ
MTFYSLQILRGLAALFVVVLHAQYDAATLAAQFSSPFSSPFAFPWTAGVDLFFVISGFIMAHTATPLFQQAGGAWHFLKRRLIRIVPLYWGVTTLYVMIALLQPQVLNKGLDSAWFIAASYFFIPVARPDGLMQPVYSLGWTLNYEMFFYLCFAGALLFKRDKPRTLLGLALALMALTGIGALFTLPQPLAFWAHPLILEFVFGMMIGLMHQRGLRLQQTASWFLMLLGFGLLFYDASRLDALITLPVFIAHGLPASLLVMAATLKAKPQQPPISLGARFMVALGDASYALYLLHPFMIRLLREIVSRFQLFPLISGWIFVICAMISAIVLALLVHHRIEKPLGKVLK